MTDDDKAAIAQGRLDEARHVLEAAQREVERADVELAAQRRRKLHAFATCLAAHRMVRLRKEALEELTIGDAE